MKIWDFMNIIAILYLIYNLLTRPLDEFLLFSLMIEIIFVSLLIYAHIKNSGRAHHIGTEAKKGMDKNDILNTEISFTLFDKNHDDKNPDS